MMCVVSCIKSIYVHILACVGVKGDESESFRIDSGMRQEYIMSPSFFNIYVVRWEGEFGV